MGGGGVCSCPDLNFKNYSEYVLYPGKNYLTQIFDKMKKKNNLPTKFPCIFLYLKCIRKNWKSHFVFRKTCLKEVSSYNDKVSSYNDKVSSYNNKVPSYNDKISSYNNKVPSYNSKVSSYNETSHHKAVTAFHTVSSFSRWSESGGGRRTHTVIETLFITYN